MLETSIRKHLSALYPEDEVDATLPRLLALVEAHRRPRRLRPVDQRDVWVIAYGDHVTDGSRPPLQVMREVLDGPLADAATGVHLLPFYPWTSDDGFAVVDHREIDPALGTWADVADIGRRRRLMVDAVVNHMSAASPHVTEWSGFAFEPGPDFDTTQVVRPRTTPLLTPFEAPDGSLHHAWTTFGPDQVDLDYRNPDVLVDMTEVLLGYLDNGASVVRLDAVGFLWKASGTTCIHLPQTHEVIRLWRTIIDHVAPGSLLVTETNVPHDENVAYFGDGGDEAHVVYQFAMAPLVLSAFVWSNAQDLTRWAASMDDPPGEATFLNFLASHDGIGLRPVEQLLSSTQVEGLCALARSAGGGVSYRSHADGSQSPYELNSTVVDMLDALADDGLGIARILAAHAIVLSMRGVAGLWMGSLLGIRNWAEGVRQTGRLRTVNRRRVSLDWIRAEVMDASTFSGSVFAGLSELIALRASSSAFAPSSPQHVLPGPPWLFGVARGHDHERHMVLVNVSGRDRALQPAALGEGDVWLDRLGRATDRPYADGDTLVLPPYGIAWLQKIG